MNILGNDNDPLKDSSKGQKALLEQFAAHANGFSREDVEAAALNLLLSVVRQNYKTQHGANDRCDQLAAEMKRILDMHYDHLGNRRSVFPFHQVIEMPLSDLR